MKLARWAFQNEDDLFKKFFAVSAILHVVVVVMMTVKTSFFPSQDLLIQSAIRVDLVGLPDKPPEKPIPQAEPKPTPAPPTPPPPAPKPAPPKPAPKPEPKPVPTPDKSKETADAQQRALERLRAMQAVERMRQEAEQKQAEEKPQPPAGPTYRGNVIATGSSFTGLERLDYERYYDDLKIHLQSFWDLPQWLADAGFRASVVVRIDERGYVTLREIYESSGNTTFDSAALSAVQAASPFPEPPDRLKGELRNALLHFRFPE